MGTVRTHGSLIRPCRQGKSSQAVFQPLMATGLQHRHLPNREFPFHVNGLGENYPPEVPSNVARASNSVTGFVWVIEERGITETDGWNDQRPVKEVIALLAARFGDQ